MRNTKIVATLGPATSTPEAVRGLIAAGVDVFRLNASHGSIEERVERIAAVREQARLAGTQTGILLDLQGPKIRLGTFEGGGTVLETGAEFTITTETVEGNAQRASTSYPHFAADVKAGDTILLADGAVRLESLATDGVAVRCRVVSGGPVGDRKGINLPGVQVSTPALTRKDLADLRSALKATIDMVALSFVRRRDDILRLRMALEGEDARLPVIAKIEKPEAWESLDQILEESDGVMVARGDLGVEMALERVPFIQKSIIARARARGRFVITATQMLESMISNPLPTRAEVSDVANAIHDGTDAVMLSAETSTGAYPAEAARLMAVIAAEAERSRPESSQGLPASPNPTYAEILTGAAYRAAAAAGAAAIAVFTSSGSSARLVARCRPSVPIYAFTPQADVARQLSVLYGVRARQTPPLRSTDEMLAYMDRTLLATGCLKQHDTIVFVAGQPIGRSGTTNLMKLHRVGELG